MKPVILLTGKNGQIGAELLRFLPQMGEVVALDREHLDLSKPDDISRAIQKFDRKLSSTQPHIQPWIKRKQMR